MLNPMKLRKYLLTLKPSRARKGKTVASKDLKRYTIIGRAYSGRLLKVPFEVLAEGIRPVTAFDAGKRDYALYWNK